MRGGRRGPDVHGPMVVAVAVAWVMKVTVDHIVEVVTVRNGRVLASRPVLVVGGVATAGMRGRARARIDPVYLE